MLWVNDAFAFATYNEGFIGSQYTAAPHPYFSPKMPSKGQNTALYTKNSDRTTSVSKKGRSK